jgi:serine protease AprX
MSTALVAGCVADILQRNPSLTPDQVKGRLMGTARGIATLDVTATGAGLVNAYAAATTAKPAANQSLPHDAAASTGLGLLQLDRGTTFSPSSNTAAGGVDAQTPLGQLQVTGEVVAQSPSTIDPANPLALVPWNAVSYTTTGWDATSWHATSWHENNWDATSWHATSWHETTWDATSWHGTDWLNSDWDATSWHATSWHDVDWDATSWHATSWHSAWYAAAWD